MKKVQFGSGLNIIPGWENTDFPAVDITKTLPYESNTIDRIFHEHVLEHIDEVDGFRFLKECFRVLKPAGIMRISIPSIDGFIHVYQNWDKMNSELKEKYRNRTHYINHVTYGEAVGYSGKMFDRNFNVKSYKNGPQWHRFLYDKGDIKDKLLKIGFKNITFVDKYHSNDPYLKGLDRRYGGQFSFRPIETDINLEALK